MKQQTITVTGCVLVSDVLLALESKLPDDLFDKLDAELDKRASERLSFDDTEVTASDALDGLDSQGLLPEPESMWDDLDQGDVQDLAAAIRRGDTPEAEALLDRIFANDTTVTEWVQRGRYSQKARPAPLPRAKAA